MPLANIAASAAVAASAAIVGASLPPPVAAPLTQAEAPVFRVGEEWKFAYTNDLDPSKNKTYVQRVASVGPEGVRLSVPSSGGPRFVDLDRNGNFVRSAVESFAPSAETLRFPLFVGKSWDAEYTYTSGDWTSHCDRESKVVAAERVSTPAGDFDAFRIESRTGYSGAAVASGAGRSYSVDWYAPAAGRVVKQDFESMPDNKNIARTSSHLILVRHTPARADQSDSPAPDPH